MPTWGVSVVEANLTALGQLCVLLTYGTTAPVGYYLSTALVLLWSSVPCRHWSRPLPSSPGLHLGSSQRLATKNWKTEANLAENSWGWSDHLDPLNFGLHNAIRVCSLCAMDRPAWRLLVDAATSSWHAPERDSVTVKGTVTCSLAHRLHTLIALCRSTQHSTFHGMVKCTSTFWLSNYITSNNRCSQQ